MQGSLSSFFAPHERFQLEFHILMALANLHIGWSSQLTCRRVCLHRPIVRDCTKIHLCTLTNMLAQASASLGQNRA